MFGIQESHRQHRAARRHHREWGPGPRPPAWLREMLDPHGPGHHPLIRRGDVRPLILAALTRQPMHGYQVIQELESQSGGRWRPSAGSVYPTLQQLEDEGLVRSQEVDGRRTYTLTDQGQAAAAEVPDRPGRWSERGRRRDAMEVRSQIEQLLGAVAQVNRLGSPQAKQEAREILVEARRQLYRLLAEDVEPASPDGSQEASDEPA